MNFFRQKVIILETLISDYILAIASYLSLKCFFWRPGNCFGFFVFQFAITDNKILITKYTFSYRHPGACTVVEHPSSLLSSTLTMSDRQKQLLLQ